MTHLVSILISMAGQLPAAASPQEMPPAPTTTKLEPVISKQGELLYAFDFEETSTLPAGWEPHESTRWKIFQGTMQGIPAPPEYTAKIRGEGRGRDGSHPRLRFRPKKTKSGPKGKLGPMILQFAVYFTKLDDRNAGGLRLNLDDAMNETGHICQITHLQGEASGRSGAGAQLMIKRDANRKKKGDTKADLGRYPTRVRFRSGTWYVVMLEYAEGSLVYQLEADGKRIAFTASDSRLESPVDHFAIHPYGAVVNVDNVNVWAGKPNPSWPRLKATIQKAARRGGIW